MTRTITVLLVLAAAAVSIWAIRQDGIKQGRAEVHAAWAKQRAADIEAAARSADRMRQIEQGLQASFEKIRQEKFREISDLNRRHAAALDSLRRHPSRPADHLPPTTTDASTGPAAGCGADQLYRQDAAVALGIALDADVVRVALQQCHAQYQASADAAASYACDTSSSSACDSSAD